MNLQQTSEEVFYNATPSVSLGKGEIDFLKEHANGTGRRRARICTHGSPESRFHEMFIVHQRDTYVRPHKHLEKVESFHVIDGSVDVIIFNENGEITDSIRMGDYASGHPFYHRIGTSGYHMFLIRSEVLVFHEATTGPFRHDDMVFAPWSPDEADSKKVAEFLRMVNSRI